MSWQDILKNRGKAKWKYFSILFNVMESMPDRSFGQRELYDILRYELQQVGKKERGMPSSKDIGSVMRASAKGNLGSMQRHKGLEDFNNLVRYIEKDIHDSRSVPKFKWAGNSK
tara:strand:+ start:1690 stop:2031 length:342 start_codon:yes stop_codon:yes gene_type:complete